MTEQAWIGSLCTDKIIPAVVGGPYDEVTGFKYVKRSLQHRSGQVRTVAIERDDSGTAVAREARKDTIRCGS